MPRPARNLIRWHFLRPCPKAVRYGVCGTEEFAAFAVGQLRGAAARSMDVVT